MTENLSYHALFLIAVGLSAAALLLTLGAKMPFWPHSGASRIEVVEKAVLPITVAVFFLFIAYGGITTFIPLFADSIGVNTGAFFLAFAATLALSRPLSGTLADRYGETVVIIPALVITMAGLLALSLSTGLRGVLVAAVLYGIGFGSAHPVLHATAIRLARSDRKGVANASFSTAIDLGIGLGAIMLGWVTQYTSYQGLFTVSAVSVAFSLLVFMFVRHLLNTGSLPSETSGAA